MDHLIPFCVGVQRGGMTAGATAEPFDAARMALAQLEATMERLGDSRLGQRPIRQAAFGFHALYERLAGVELQVIRVRLPGRSHEQAPAQVRPGELIPPVSVAAPRRRGRRAHRCEGGRGWRRPSVERPQPSLAGSG